MSRWCFLALVMVSVQSKAQAGQFCHASAETYYEQVYCQLQSKAQTKGLPAFREFRKNPESVQFSLLRRPAERNAIKLPAPVRNTNSQPSESVRAVSSQVLAPPETIVEQQSAREVITNAVRNPPLLINPDAEHCQLLGKALNCGAQTYVLLGNKANHRLQSGVLTDTNKMALPVYHGGDFNKYLTSAYHQYITKMCEIGLGGVTMTYGKFSYLYQDIKSKGLDFAQRFEMMYGFLKKDKSAMGVNESASVPQGLTVNDCSPLNPDLYVCDKHGRNFIFARQ